MQERVQKIISQWGIASRRQAEQMIADGRVRLNGEIAQLGQKGDPQRDRLTVDGKPIKPHHRPQLVYFLLNKPAGVVSTCFDPQKRKTVIDLLPRKLRQGCGIHPVGRLDADTTGALLLTNDGAWTQHFSHPRYLCPKTYRVWVEGRPSESALQAWREGVVLSGEKTQPAQVKVLATRPDRTLLRVILHEGKNRQIRRIAQQLGFEVLQLHRTAIGSIRLQPPREPMLPRGKIRALKDWEIKGRSPQKESGKRTSTGAENLIYYD